MPDAEPGRVILPALLKPSNYDIVLAPEFSGFKFDGRVAIEFTALKSTPHVILNASHLAVHSAILELELAAGSEKCTFSVSQEDETVTVNFANELAVGAKGKLVLEFTGELNDQMAGFYRSGWSDPKTGEKRWMGVTQFEATDARRSFPCFDEPALKATFDISLAVDSDLVAISNMNEIECTALPESWALLPSGAVPAGSGKKMVKFARTPIMSTYLVAYAVGPLGYVSNDGPDRISSIPVRVYAPLGMESQGRLGVVTTEKILAFFEEYYGIKYPLPKCDLLAVPDFGAGAMENFGLITYRTVLLLFDEEKSSARARQNIEYVIGHELAHQWFGNLVTMSWWTDLWLNEGFATYAGWLAVDHLHPDWHVWTMFVQDDLQRGLGLDALRSSHPVEVPIGRASEISQIFDAISYSKGASVIRQLAGWLGPSFATGIRAYLQKYLYANATTSDLWRELSLASGRDVGGNMGLWTKETGFPLLSVLEEKREGGKVTLKLKQERYLSTGDLTKEEEERGVVMQIPLGILTEKGQGDSTLLFSVKEGTVDIDSAEDGFVKLNSGQTGFYRVKYTAAQLARLGQNLDKLDSTDRVGLVADAFALAQAGYSGTVEALDLVSYYGAENDYVVLSELASRLGQVGSAFYAEPAVVEGIKRIQRGVFARLVKELGFEYPEAEKGDHLKALMRTLAISQACKGDDVETIAEARRRFEKYTDASNPDASAIHPNLRGVVFSTVLKNATDVDSGRAIFSKIMSVYKNADTADQRLAALASLGALKQRELVEELLVQILDTEVVRPQDLMYPLNSLCKEGADPAWIRPRAWKWVQDNWETLYIRYHSSHSLLARMLQIAVEDISSASIIDEVRDFVTGAKLDADGQAKRKSQCEGIMMGVNQSMEKINANSKWVARDAAALRAWAAKGN